MRVAYATSLVACALVSCTSAGTGRLRDGDYAAMEEETMGQAVELVDRDVLAEMVAEGGYVAVIRVTEAAIRRGGTRSERFVAAAEVLYQLHGELSSPVTIQRFTSGGDTVLRSGRTYVVALQTVPAFSQHFTLRGHVAVAEDAVPETVEEHKRVLESLGG